jgi:hypothetical protein
MSVRGWLLCALLLSPSAFGAPRTESDRLKEWKISAAVVLSARGDANSLATAALLSPTQGPELAARASALAPESATFAWVRLRLCAIAPPCDFRDAATAMRWVAPANPAAWLPTLNVAFKDGDTVETERVLFDMSQGKHFAVYATDVAVLMFDALKAVAKSLPMNSADSDASRLSLAIIVAAAKLVPPFTTLEEVCRESAPGTERHDACMKIARTLQRGDTVRGELAGITIEKRLVAPDSKEALALSERRRVLESQESLAGHFDTPLLPWSKNAHARWHLARMRALPREQDVLLAILREQGTPSNPPVPAPPPAP